MSASAITCSFIVAKAVIGGIPSFKTMYGVAVNISMVTTKNSEQKRASTTWNFIENANFILNQNITTMLANLWSRQAEPLLKGAECICKSNLH